MIPIKERFAQHLKKNYPRLGNLSSNISDNIISPFRLTLPSHILYEIQNTIASFNEMRENPHYINHYKLPIEQLGLKDPQNKSIMMSYDFHVNSQNHLELIEINTNAAFLILGYELYQATNTPLPVADFSKNSIKEMILHELRLRKNNIENPHVAIIDNHPEQQRLYIEFLIYQELFKQFGWECSIQDYREITAEKIPDFIYNRHTDFYLNDSSSHVLKTLWQTDQLCLSPNPYEYFLLADKERMFDWSQENFLESLLIRQPVIDSIRKALLKTEELTETNAENLWSNRKKLFFKPKQAFGSKMTYKGASISRKAYQELIKTGAIAQTYSPASEVTFEIPQEGPVSMKYDLRCYAYQEKLQLVIARLYQGQVTNTQTRYGGFACVEFNDSAISS